jgi:hypothetical protein
MSASEATCGLLGRVPLITSNTTLLDALRNLQPTTHSTEATTAGLVRCRPSNVIDHQHLCQGLSALQP